MNKKKYLSRSIFLLGIICLLWIIYDIKSIYTDLESIIYLGKTGVYVGTGYLIIIIYHLAVIYQYLKIFRKINKNIQKTISVLLILSILSLLISKVMFDEVRHEYYIEYPMPGETHFIIIGLIINAVFIIFTMFSLSKENRLIGNSKIENESNA